MIAFNYLLTNTVLEVNQKLSQKLPKPIADEQKQQKSGKAAEEPLSDTSENTAVPMVAVTETAEQQGTGNNVHTEDPAKQSGLRVDGDRAGPIIFRLLTDT